MTPEQYDTCDQVLSVHETGHLLEPAAYATATLLADGAGISYGRAQATGATLASVITQYGIRGGSYARAIQEAMGSHGLGEARSVLREADAPDWLRELLVVLRLAGGDSVMRATQDAVIRSGYLYPAEDYVRRLGCVEPLTVLAAYDLWVQSGAGRIDALRPNFAERPPVRGGDERAWTVALIRARRAWLAGFTDPSSARQALVRRTVYRCDSLLQLATEGRWDLARPLAVRGQTIR